MYLHKNTKTFENTIKNISTKINIDPSFIEKDYYITIILKTLKDKCPNIIFKGGTSLSKCFNAINRFSEDIDISFEEHLGESKRSNLKNNIIKSISEELDLPIVNWNILHSNNNVNKYIFSYKSVIETINDQNNYISLEVSLVVPSFPSQNSELGNYIYKYKNYLSNIDISEYELAPFTINWQTLERTFIDKVFAICDYYLLGKSARLSRHLYDLHKLFSIINKDNILNLIKEVQVLRSKIDLCPSAKPTISINELLNNIIDSNYYKKDYKNVTMNLIYDNTSYNECIETIKTISSTIPFPIL